MVKDSALSEITLRKYERPYDADKREITKKVCLSLGLLQAGDSRDVIVDILLVLLDERKNRNKLSSIEIKQKVEELRKKHNLELKGIAESNIRRQLKKLRDIMLVEKQNNLYYVAEFENLSNLFEQKIEKFIIPQTLERIKEYLRKVEE